MREVMGGLSGFESTSVAVQQCDLLQGSPIPTFVIDAAHIITRWNAACEHALGFAAIDMLGTRRQWEPFYPTARPVMADLLLDDAPEEEISRLYGSCWCRSPLIDGAYEAEDYYPELGLGGTWLFFTAAPLRDAVGRVVGVIETLQDITERKRAEEELLHYHNRLEQEVRSRTAELSEVIKAHQLAQDELHRAHLKLAAESAILAETNEELTQYAFVVSHDLRSPLRAIRNYSDFLLEELDERLNEEQRQYFNGLKRALSHGEELVSDLLDFSHIGKKELMSQRIDAGLLLRELIHSKRIPPDVEVVMQDTWPLVSADRILFEQIFRNLISNAVKFNRSSNRRVELGWQPLGEGRCELFVRDNGIGIDPRYHEQVFRMLQRLHTQKEFEGTGIGLAIVRKAAARQNGSVRLESMPGKGCTVFISLPLWENRVEPDV